MAGLQHATAAAGIRQASPAHGGYRATDQTTDTPTPHLLRQATLYAPAHTQSAHAGAQALPTPPPVWLYVDLQNSQYPLGLLNPQDPNNPGPVAAAHKGDSDRPTPNDRLTRKHRSVASASEHASAKEEAKVGHINRYPATSVRRRQCPEPCRSSPTLTPSRDEGRDELRSTVCVTRTIMELSRR